MPPPLPPDKRAAIAAAIQAGGTRNQIARDHDVAGRTVTKIAEEDGIDTSAWDRVSTERATEAARLDMAAWRTDFAQRLARRAEWIEQRLDEELPTVVGGKEGAQVVMSEATSTDVRNLMTALGIAVDKVGVLTRDDAQGLAAVDSWLRSLGVGHTS